MKKQYSKPGIYIEEFTIAENIATCGAKPGGVGSSTGSANPTVADKYHCGWDVGGYTVWTQANAGCTVKLKEDGTYKGYCYNNPAGGNSIFNS